MAPKIKRPSGPPSSKPDVGLVVGGRYRLERELARGGMGTVWVARHVALGYRLAVKLINPSELGYADAHERFEREARAIAVLGTITEHVVRIIDYGVDVRGPYLAMDLLQGETLEERLAARGRLPPREAAGLLAQIARGLRKAHGLRMVHRDLKPENVFLARHEGEDERVKLLDFGIVKLLGPSGGALRTQVAGTLHYLSPELLDEQPIDVRADLWSLGVMLYRMVVGRLPFVAPDMPALMRAIRTGDAAPPTQIRARLGADMDAFFARALQRDPARRFQDVDALEAAFALAARVSRRPPPPSAPTSLPPLEAPPVPDSASALTLVHTPVDLLPTQRSPVTSP
jgi:serine/threonine-protein kinase